MPAFHLSIHHSPNPGPFFFPPFAIFHALGFVYKLLHYLNCRGRGCWEESEKAGLRRNNSAPLHFHLNGHKMCKSCSWEFHVRGLPCHCPSRTPSLFPPLGKTSVGRDACNSRDRKATMRVPAGRRLPPARVQGDPPDVAINCRQGGGGLQGLDPAGQQE